MMVPLVGIDVTSHLIGLVTGCVYIVTLASILWWMLHVPPAGGTEQKVGRVIREAVAYARILVPVQGNALSHRMMALGCQMAKYRDAELTILYVIEVPLTLPANATMVDDEQRAQEAFKLAARIADRYNVKLKTGILKARQAGPGIVQAAQAGQFDVILMGDLPRQAGSGTQFARSTEYVFEHAHPEVIIDRPQLL